MGYEAPTWQNGGPPALNAKNMQDISDNLAYVSNNMVNPKILDNWYWGNPVDQKKGHISLQGVPVYNDAACTSLIGNQTETAATCIKSGTNYQRIINGQGGGYVKAADVVRGYTGAGYTIDRWKLDVGDGVTIDNGLNIIKANSYLGQYFDDFDKYIGRQLVGAVLMGDGNLYTGTCVYNGSLNQGQILFANNRLGMYIKKLSGTLTQVEINTVLANEKIRAVGLELGPQQTLAHQENGVWVLNEIPKFGDQLAECQRYCYKPYHVLLWRTPGTNSLTVDANFKVDMRAVPAAIYTNPLTVLVPGKTANGSITLSNLVVNVGGVGNCDLTSVDPSDAEVLQIEGAQIAFSADL